MSGPARQRTRARKGTKRARTPSPSPERFQPSIDAARILWQPRVLKQDDAFAVLNPFGNVDAAYGGEAGLYYRDTRHLSHFELRLNNERLLLLGSKVSRSDNVLWVDLTNPDFGRPDWPAESIHLSRRQFLWRGAYRERVTVRNFHHAEIELLLQFTFDADFADIFEVRGHRRRMPGERLHAQVNGHSVTLRYHGLDDVLRQTRLTFDGKAAFVSPTMAGYKLTLAPGETETVTLTIDFSDEPASDPPRGFAPTLRDFARSTRMKKKGAGRIETSNELCNEWIAQSVSDLYALISRTRHGRYPYAGIPWFNCPFGRDGLITALLTLWKDPSIARGTLEFLAATQAREIDPAREAEPGKILHEMRFCEMAATGEVPFGRYYGSVDATPLFVILAGAYLERTGDSRLIRRLWPHIEAALRWIDDYGDVDGDGFVEYVKHSPTGLVNQGWKDSDDSVFHADGGLAEGPIALCEVQAYVYAAKRHAANIATRLGKVVEAETLSIQAGLLREQFETAFWCEDLGTYAMALDGAKAPCRVRTSNAGHALFAGIASKAHARVVADQLVGRHFLTTYGIRTVADTEARYNPVSYHNGSIWPHDNALIALGFSRYGLQDHALKVFESLFHASRYMDLHRLPELYCGLEREAFYGPVLYPSACAPQAWASAAVFGLFAACLGMEFEPGSARIVFHEPVLPAFLEEVWLRDLRVGDSRLDLTVRRHPNNVSIKVAERSDGAEIVVRN